MNQIENIETFRLISGFPLYMVSNFGRVLATKTGKILKLRRIANGYHGVTLRKNNESFQFRLHRLVANEFIPNPQRKPFVDHIDRNPYNNCCSNLRWCTSNENNRNSEKRINPTSSIYKGVSKVGNKFVAYLSIDGRKAHIGTFRTERDAGIAYNEKAAEHYREFANLNNII